MICIILKHFWCLIVMHFISFPLFIWSFCMHISLDLSFHIHLGEAYVLTLWLSFPSFLLLYVFLFFHFFSPVLPTNSRNCLVIKHNSKDILHSLVFGIIFHLCCGHISYSNHVSCCLNWLTILLQVLLEQQSISPITERMRGYQVIAMIILLG